ncbi:unnamed protein product [Lactuca saligna]|uniref:Uncharacterized protein n=1 Tax=Lactuca saligna TaxID=75948 RepID=A0AA35YC21_LACSI|nr:unnamed protein product [Lactuca saligna]
MIHLASPLVTSPPATSGLPHYKSTNDKLILITEWFHSQLGVQLLHRTDDYECDSSTTPVIASRLTSLTATLIGLSIQLDFSFQLEIDFVASPALHLFTKISLHLSTKIFTVSLISLQGYLIAFVWFIPYTESLVKTIVVVVAKSKCGIEPL